MTEEKTLTYSLNIELSDREIFLIGQIMAQWGLLEHTVFTQTLLTFETSEDEEPQLPKEMNNIQFSGVLELWKQRVIEPETNEHYQKLSEQFDEIVRLKPGRDALIHGMWRWNPDEISKITSVRVRKRQIVEFHFTADDLEDFRRRVSSVNFHIRYPGGIEDLAQERAKEGIYMSRRFLAAMSGDVVENDWLSDLLGSKKR